MKKGLFISIFILGALSSMFSATVSAYTYPLGMIDVRFCNYDQTNKELDLATKEGSELPLCVQFTNKTDQSVTVNVDFLDSTITSDATQERACNAADRPKKYFGNYLQPYTGDITIPPKETIEKTYAIAYPMGFNGLSHGCMAYNIVGSDTKQDNLIVRIRSIRYIDVFVSKEKTVQMVSIPQDPVLKKVGNEYTLSVWVENKGNVDEKVRIVNVITNIFGYLKEISFDATIPANSGTLLTSPSFILPIYGGPFRVNSSISYMPEFNFNITNGKHAAGSYGGGIENKHIICYIRTRQTRMMIFVFVLFITRFIFLFRKRKSQAVIQ